MDTKAASLARARLNTANAQLVEAEKATSHDEFAGHWYLFLVSAKNVYTKLEQGAKSTPQSRQWFGEKKNERRTDPLLQYLFQARDDDEHGIADVTKFEPGSLSIGKFAPGASNAMQVSLSIDEGIVTINKLNSLDGKPIMIESIPGRSILSPVTGRGAITYPPPTEHMGHPLSDNLPVTVGKLAISYLEKLVSEAEARAA